MVTAAILAFPRSMAMIYFGVPFIPCGRIVIPSQDNDRPSDWLARQLGVRMLPDGCFLMRALSGPGSETPPPQGGRIWRVSIECNMTCFSRLAQSVVLFWGD